MGLIEATLWGSPDSNGQSIAYNLHFPQINFVLYLQLDHFCWLDRKVLWFRSVARQTDHGSRKQESVKIDSKLIPFDSSQNESNTICVSPGIIWRRNCCLDPKSNLGPLLQWWSVYGKEAFLTRRMQLSHSLHNNVWNASNLPIQQSILDGPKAQLSVPQTSDPSHSESERHPPSPSLQAMPKHKELSELSDFSRQ